MKWIKAVTLDNIKAHQGTSKLSKQIHALVNSANKYILQVNNKKHVEKV